MRVSTVHFHALQNRSVGGEKKSQWTFTELWTLTWRNPLIPNPQGVPSLSWVDTSNADGLPKEINLVEAFQTLRYRI